MELKIVTNVNYSGEQAKAIGGTLDQVIDTAINVFGDPNDKFVQFVKALPKCTEMIEKFLKPTEGFEESTYTINIQRTGTKKAPAAKEI